ncbi:uncharacterized protein SPSC_03441 [Sporisorium scitamineum]|uniref:Uncharacterized protein n=1 Tax=Sporisorium scitamineum TaxID=49012 RepID=A0A0F7S6X1_9BASI|nr:uncharacterized protein SPSC_03441 [Sporisorium scitamineum]CDW96625.1 hypothetical protein [Sporisorium scitamineum]
MVGLAQAQDKADGAAAAGSGCRAHIAFPSSSSDGRSKSVVHPLHARKRCLGVTQPDVDASLLANTNTAAPGQRVQNPFFLASRMLHDVKLLSKPGFVDSPATKNPTTTTTTAVEQRMVVGEPCQHHPPSPSSFSAATDGQMAVAWSRHLTLCQVAVLVMVMHSIVVFVFVSFLIAVWGDALSHSSAQRCLVPATTTAPPLGIQDHAILCGLELVRLGATNDSSPPAHTYYCSLLRHHHESSPHHTQRLLQLSLSSSRMPYTTRSIAKG